MVTSRFLCTVLRHKPEAIGIELDRQGWTDVNKLLKQLASHKLPTTLDELKQIVKENNKQRFSFNDKGTKIRANQGHSVPVDLGLEEIEPPEILYHGTVYKFVKSILKDGLKKMNRHHVHLSGDLDTAKNVGSRRGTPVILEVKARQMCDDGFKFYKSTNNVWLTENVPSEYIRLYNITYEQSE